jgi:uncharacterized protein (DUF2461 family)
MMRSHRDIRFSKDKSPYKTFVAAHFWHAKGKEGDFFDLVLDNFRSTSLFVEFLSRALGLR